MARTTEDIDAVNFTLELELDQDETTPICEEIEEEEMQDVNDIVAEAMATANFDDDTNDFIEQNCQRHAHVTDKILDDYAEENHAPSTKEQTRWAVKIFKGIFQQVSAKFCPEFKK